MEEQNIVNFMELLERGLSAPDDNDLFQLIVQESGRVLLLTDKVLADQVGTSRPTISRWRSGVCAPYILIRKGVYRLLQKHAKQISRQKMRDTTVKSRSNKNKHVALGIID